MIPVRGLPVRLSCTVKGMTLVPAPAFALKVIQSTFAAAIHPQSVAVASVSVPSVLAAGKSRLVGEIMYMQGDGGGLVASRLIVPFWPTTKISPASSSPNDVMFNGVSISSVLT